MITQLLKGGHYKTQCSHCIDTADSALTLHYLCKFTTTLDNVSHPTSAFFLSVGGGIHAGETKKTNKHLEQHSGVLLVPGGLNSIP